MKKALTLLIILLIITTCLAACGKQEPVERSDVEGERVSLIVLVVKPKDFNGVRATVRGYLRAEEDGVALYVSQEDSQYETHISAVWLGTYEEIETFSKEEIQDLDGIYVGVTGTIEAGSFGPAYEYNCEMARIENIKAVEMVEATPTTDIETTATPAA